MSILRYFAGVYEHFTHDQAKHFLPHVLNPIYRILDEAGDLTSIDSGGWIGRCRVGSAFFSLCPLDEMRLLATEVRDFVQSKVGTTDFFRAWDRLRRRVNERREGRKDARNRMVSSVGSMRHQSAEVTWQVVANPQAWAERRDKRGVIKKESKKRKGKASGCVNRNHTLEADMGVVKLSRWAGRSSGGRDTRRTLIPCKSVSTWD